MKPTTLRFDRLEARLAPAVATWDGGGADNRWTTAANWVGDVAAQPGDDLVFPASTFQRATVNDFPAGTAFHSVDVENPGFGGYRLTGNAVALAAGLSVEGAGTEIGLPLILTADQTFSGDGGAVTGPGGHTLSGSVDLNGHGLTITGVLPRISGPITGTGNLFFTRSTAFLTGVSTFSGPTTVFRSTLVVDGTLPGPVTVLPAPDTFGYLTGSGTVGDATVNAQLWPGNTWIEPLAPGTLRTGNLDLTNSVRSVFRIFAPGSAGGVSVTGTVELGGGLEIFTPPGFRGFGRPYTLIDNDGTDAVVGTFGVPEGGIVFAFGVPTFRITYRGGDGNDVVLTDAGGPAYAVGAGAGGLPIVNLYAADGRLINSFLAYATSFRGGVRVATADVNGDGVADVITAPGPGGGPHIRVFDGGSFAVVKEFMAYDARFTGGVFVAASQIYGLDNMAEIITGAGAGGGPHVKVFDGGSGATLSSFMAYDPRFTGGVSVAGTDSFTVGRSGGRGSVITGAGPGGGPHVKVFGLDDAGNAFSGPGFMAYDPAFRGGVNVASRGPFYDLIPGSLLPGAQRATAGAIVTSPASNGVPDVRVFGPTGQQVGDFGQIGSFLAYDARFLGGVTVGVQEISTNGAVTLQTGAGRGGGPHVKTWQVANNVATQQQSFYAFDPAFTGGIFVG